MTKKFNFEEFRVWQNEKNGRLVRIDIGSVFDEKDIIAWVYDHDMGVGQFVKSVEEINLDWELTKKIEREVNWDEKHL